MHMSDLDCAEVDVAAESVCFSFNAGGARGPQFNDPVAAREQPQPSPEATLPHVLSVDNDPTVRSLLVDYLGQNGLRVTAVSDGSSMKAVLAEQVVDLIVLDPRLKSEDGMVLACNLRSRSAIPLIMLSGRAEEADRVMGLELGADDYLTKPFRPRELLARIRSILRRCSAQVPQGRPGGVRAYRFDRWELNLGTRRLADSSGQQVRLGNHEFNLLVVLLGSPQRILTRGQLLDFSRLYNDEIYDRSVDVQIMRLRRKLENDPAQPRYIKTQRGAGYVFGVPVKTVY